MNHYKRNNGALFDALGVVIAVAITAAISLIAASQYSALRASSVTPPRSEVCVNCGSTPSEPSASMADEPELMRTDRANEHHG
jgi:formate dehydrogenase maturation protein FdhE